MLVKKIEFSKLELDQKFHVNGIDYIKTGDNTGNTIKYNRQCSFSKDEIVYNTHFYTDIASK